MVPYQNKHMASDSETVLHTDGCLDTETSTMSIQKDVCIASLKPISDNGISSTDILWSPTCDRRTCDYYESVEKNEDQPDLLQSVIYQNEEGKWVTDLAYYTSFDNEQDVNISLTDEMNEDFRSGSEALNMIAQDEEKFNKEHQFIQEENIEAQNISVALADTSWVATVNYNLLRKSLSTSELGRDDASYIRLSLGEFFAQRSEALGCLGGGNSVKRPSFGYFISSPEKREPVALISKSDVSGSDLEKRVAHPNQDLSSGDLDEQSETQPSEGSITLRVEALEGTSLVDESDVTLTANKDKTEGTGRKNKLPVCNDQLQDSGDSVLRISTIASAIADASVSTEPSQLAAMLKALTNKAKDKILQEDDEEDSSTVSHFVPNDSEKSNGSSAFDMEKYLIKTEISRHEGGLETVSRTGMSDIWDLSLPKEQTIQDIHTVDSGATNTTVTEPKENTEAVFCVENGESQESFKAVNSSNSVLTNTRENESVVVGMKTLSTDHRLPDIGSKEKAASISTSTSNSYSSLRNPIVTSLYLLEECEEKQASRENQRQQEYVSETSGSDRHVTFDQHCRVSPKNVDLKNASPEHGGSGSEDQESFRPSTSPLSHSSPGEISGTSLSRCVLESLDSAACHQKSSSESELSQLVCSHTDMSRLTYVSEQESACPPTTAGSGPEDCK
ncbi:Hypothetical predicted protein, partial [Marmota monax]